MATKTYSEKLKDPRWQKKRLNILNRDNFTCQLCGDDKESLQVHHKKYISGKDPWDIDDKFLITYCQLCHCTIEYINKTSFNCSVLSSFKVRISPPDIWYIYVFHIEECGLKCIMIFRYENQSVTFSANISISEWEKVLNISKSING